VAFGRLKTKGLIDDPIVIKKAKKVKKRPKKKPKKKPGATATVETKPKKPLPNVTKKKVPKKKKKKNVTPKENISVNVANEIEDALNNSEAVISLFGKDVGNFDISEKHQKFIDHFIMTDCRVVSYQAVYPNSSYQAAAASACEILKDPKSQKYLEIRRSMISAGRLFKLELLTDEMLKIGLYNHDKEKISTDRCDDVESDEGKKKNNKFIRVIHDKNFVLKDDFGGSYLSTGKDYEFSHPYTPGQKIAAAGHAIRILKTDNSDNGADSKDNFVKSLWDRFRNKDREDTISALDFAFELESRKYEVPVFIAAQAKKEIELMELRDSGGDDEGSTSYEELDRKWLKGQLEAKKQLEHFIPERKETVNKLYKQYGYDVAEKDVDQVIDDSSILDPGDGEE
jgi:hypothetical protein